MGGNPSLPSSTNGRNSDQGPRASPVLLVSQLCAEVLNHFLLLIGFKSKNAKTRSGRGKECGNCPLSRKLGMVPIRSQRDVFRMHVINFRCMCF